MIRLKTWIKRFNAGIFTAILLTLAFCIPATVTNAQKAAVKPQPVAQGRDGRFVYTPDSLGNRIPDFSYCGYKASDVAIPTVEIKVVVPVAKGDATLRIQAALDHVASLPLDAKGFRGAVLLQKGTYEVNGQLRITASGVVLRGSGCGTNGTVILGAGLGRLALIKIIGKNDIPRELTGMKITDPYVPVNAMQFHVDSSIAFKEHSDKIIIRRPSTKEWIAQLGTDIFGGGISALGWKPGDHDLFFDRKIMNIEGNMITIDAPITTALDSNYGRATIYFYNGNGRINNAGVENLRCVSAFDKNNPKDEDHRWNAVNIENAEDAWVRQLVFENFAGSAVSINENSKRVTVEDCRSFNPVSEIGGQRRYTFFTNGQQTLFQRCYAEYGYHDFATGYCSPGPNAFVQCESHLPYNFSGGIDSWSSGILFDIVNVDGNALRFGNRGQDANGAGWAAANSLFWNCSAARIDCYKPPTAQNWAFGSWSQFAGDGYWTASNDAVNPRSFFYAQLKDRLNKNTDAQSRLMKVETEASSSPTVEQATALTAASVQPHMQLNEWIDLAAVQNKIDTNSKGIKTIDQIGYNKPAAITLAPSMKIENGWLLRGKALLTGRRQEVPWWNGGVQGKDLLTAQPAITRFVPGRTGKGLTDDLDEMTNDLLAKHIIGLEQHYGLWYDRRRDDHERIRRMDGEVWPPFYELPFARSGKETAWDGLSKYDLTKYNPFYWSRLKQYADLADQKGLILVHENYFQHNIIEAGAHYADFPWRTANNINNTGFPEPPPYAGDKRIFMAEQFYDITNPVRRELHKKYIRQCLENFRNNNGVIQLIGEEFTGPLHFVKFWLDVIRDWEKETGKKEIIGLAVTKDVQDSILANPAYRSVVDLIDIRYWHYQADGTAYAPAGGQNLAPRQHARLLKPKKTSFEQVYRAVDEYRKNLPGKAVIYSGDSFDAFGWAVFMAGGSLPVIPNLPAQFLEDAALMKPSTSGSNKYALAGNDGFIIYEPTSLNVNINSSDEYMLNWVDAKTGNIIGSGKLIKGAAIKDETILKSQGVIAWCVKNKKTK